MRVPENFEYVISHLYPRVSAKVKEDIASWMTPSMREKYGDQLSSFEFSEQDQKELILNHCFSPAHFVRYCSILQDGIWVVYVNTHRNRMPFFTSDNPVLVEGVGKKRTGLFQNGFAKPSTCIFYPLSPSIAVQVFSRQGIVGLTDDKYDGKLIPLSEQKFILRKNILIMEQAYHHSFIPQPFFDEIASNLQKETTKTSLSS